MHSVGAIGNHNLCVFIVTDGKHRCGHARAPAPQDAKAGLSVVAKVPRAECAVDLPCARWPPGNRCVPDMLKTPSTLALTVRRIAAECTLSTSAVEILGPSRKSRAEPKVC
jgi:hypothetical protein